MNIIEVFEVIIPVYVGRDIPETAFLVGMAGYHEGCERIKRSEADRQTRGRFEEWR
ncbi:hypothetical protein H6G81_17700 [Scytonema hofmannii FACHB-248]|uniref:Uncharacterized protein n=1 Tax=Scytonema hofmannii FACHB-248 TaxID=1842502 RepID=A0ABR8GSY1_9CYAN|nr:MULTISPECIES: hypothetical protein [Nostocales]MBD2606314.1 hypothetical protein [Scytonema hofmannii FACHB-248]